MSSAVSLPPRLACTLRRHAGFTLIELMIAVVVVGILAAVALPSYMDSVRKGRRSDAAASINTVLQAQERWRGVNTAYSPNVTNLATSNYGAATTSPQGYYTITTSTDVSTEKYAYVVTATAVAGKSQASDSGCTALTLTYNATSTPSLVYGPTNCWNK